MKTVSAPPLSADLEDLLRRLRLPHIRRHAPEVIATAKAQRWEPASHRLDEWWRLRALTES